MEINTIIFAIRSSWSVDTAYSIQKNDFLNRNPALGQCAVSAVVLNDYVGGIIKKGIVNGCVKHYWNCIDGVDIDITSDQFILPITVDKTETIDKNKLLNDLSFYNRYQKLKIRVEQFLNDFSSLEEDIRKCQECCEYVEKFSKQTVYFGNSNKVLIVGEAPAKTGWRTSGKVWKTPQGDIIPSGKRLKELLSICQIDLFDCSFIEAVKCYPKKRKDVTVCAKKCYNFLKKQIDLLSPDIIITLGKIPTQILIPKQFKLNEIVGIPHTVVFEHKKYTVFPIFHPSPASPQSLKGNLLLMPSLQVYLKEHQNV